MATDLARFALPSIGNLSASTLTEALAYDPISGGFVVLTFNAHEAEGFITLIREFAVEVRQNAITNRVASIHAFRQIRRDELGGAIPYDQPICDELLDRAEPIQALILNNSLANWVLFLEFESHASASGFVEGLSVDQNVCKALIDASATHTFGAFRNMRRYAHVLSDPDLIHFFNLFPGPGNLDVMWQAWQDSLPWFFEITELHSSFPLLALRDDQPVLLVNHAHWDSLKHFIHGAIYDPFLRENIMQGIYLSRQVRAPQPFFCKTVPV